MANLNWPGLLAWSTKYHDGTAPSNFKQMSAEDREFLEKAMEEAFGKIEDPNEVMKEAINQIKDSSRTDESIITALEVLDRSCDDPDCARNAEKLDGIQPLLDLLKTHNGPILIRSLEILALLFSNNPNIQEVGVRRGAVEALTKLVKSNPVGSEERAKAFRACVALVRNMQAFEEAFLQQYDGMGIIISCLNLEEQYRVREKAASFIRSLAQDGRLGSAELAALSKAVVPLFEGLGKESIQYRETLAQCACELALVSKSECPQELRAAMQARLGEIASIGDADTAQEKESLQECLAGFAVTGTATASSAA